jgi:hypothetical protein
MSLNTLYLNAITSDSTGVTVKNGCSLRIEESTGTFVPVVTQTGLSSVDTRLTTLAASNLSEAKTYADNKITALINGSEAALDTLKELADQLRSDETAAGNLLDRVTANKALLDAEVADRIADVASEKAAREAAVLAEENARKAAITTEVAERNAAIKVETDARVNALGLESNARENADLAEQAARVKVSGELYHTLFSQRNVPLTGAVYADENAPMPIPATQLATLGQSGWYYKNASTNPKTKINWYSAAPGNASGVCKASELNEVAAAVKLISNVELPFITIYTKSVGGDFASNKGDWRIHPEHDASTWYHSRTTFQVSAESAASLKSGGSYVFQFAPGSGYSLNPTANDCVVRKNGFASVLLEATEHVGQFLPGMDILFIAVSTNSAATANAVEFILHDMTMMSSNDNVVLSYSNADVLNKYLQDKLNSLYVQLGGASASILL